MDRALRKLTYRTEENLKTMKIKKDNSESHEFFQIGEVFTYFFRKKDPNRKTNINLKMMHGINKISILIFLIGMIYFISKYIF